MAAAIFPNERLFLDTSFAIALLVTSDSYHQRALGLLHSFEQARAIAVTTRAVLLEIGNGLSRQRNRASAQRFLRWLEEDPIVAITPLSEDLWCEGLELFESRPDKDWGMTDCISFTVMQQLGVRRALTADVHFEQAGFEALLR